MWFSSGFMPDGAASDPKTCSDKPCPKEKKEKYICKQCIPKYPYPCKNACVCVYTHSNYNGGGSVLLF